MTHDPIAERRRALEESFFAKRNYELLEQLRHRQETEERRTALAAASGIQNERVLEHLADLDFQAKTLAALALFPLVYVAWADGVVQENEREAVLKAAHEKGIEEGSEAWHLLDSWLQHQPKESLLLAWKEYVAALANVMSREMHHALRDDVLGRALEVAEAAGGIFGVGAVTKSENAALDELKRAFG